MTRSKLQKRFDLFIGGAWISLLEASCRGGSPQWSQSGQ